MFGRVLRANLFSFLFSASRSLPRPARRECENAAKRFLSIFYFLRKKKRLQIRAVAEIKLLSRANGSLLGSARRLAPCAPQPDIEFGG